MCIFGITSSCCGGGTRGQLTILLVPQGFGQVGPVVSGLGAWTGENHARVRVVSERQNFPAALVGRNASVAWSVTGGLLCVVLMFLHVVVLFAVLR